MFTFLGGVEELVSLVVADFFGEILPKAIPGGIIVHLTKFIFKLYIISSDKSMTVGRIHPVLHFLDLLLYILSPVPLPLLTLSFFAFLPLIELHLQHLYLVSNLRRTYAVSRLFCTLSERFSSFDSVHNILHNLL